MSNNKQSSVMDENFDYVKSNEKTLPMLEKIYGDCATDKTATFQVPKNKQMSNNKQSMKLYTEEEIRNAMRADFIVDEEIDNLINKLTPIELPSDEEIDVHVEEDFINAKEVHKYSEETQLLMKAMCKAGALWMRDKIQGGNK